MKRRTPRYAIERRPVPVIAAVPVLIVRKANGGPVLLEMPVDVVALVRCTYGGDGVALAPGELFEAELRGQFGAASFVFVSPRREP